MTLSEVGMLFVRKIQKPIIYFDRKTFLSTFEPWPHLSFFGHVFLQIDSSELKRFLPAWE
jgi:hypothetical protein